MIFTLEVLKALEGDCLLLHWGDPANPRLAIIDGGPGQTYEKQLRIRLDEIVDNRNIGPIEVEFAMVSHVDNDHIVGIDKLFGVLRSEVQNNQQRPLRVKRLWHNTFDDIVGNKLDAHLQAFTAEFTASAGGSLPPGSVKPIADRLQDELGDKEQAEHIAYDISMVLAGHKEGRNLRDKHSYLREQNAIGALNAPFSLDGHGTLITAQRTPDPIELSGLNIHIVGPREEEIEALQAGFDKYLLENQLNTAEAALAAYADKSVPNLSSIVCMVSMEIGGEEKTMLLTGDARGDHMVECLRKAGYLDGTPAEHLHVDILKVPHHGSEHNVEPRFFEQIGADTYVLSANGRYGNPDRPVVEWIIASRDKEDDYHIVLTYPVDALDQKRQQVAGAKWDHQRDSLAVLFDEKEQQGYKFKVTTNAPIPLELGDESIDW